MEIITLFENALIERFKADCVVEALTKRIQDLVKNKVHKKYQSDKFNRDGYEFSLLGVDALFYSYKEDCTIRSVKITLDYIVNPEYNKLPKAKREKLLYVKNRYFEWKKFVDFCDYKIKLWDSFHYDVPLNEILSGNFNLQLPHRYSV